MKLEINLPEELWVRMSRAQDAAQVDWSSVCLAALERRCSVIESMVSTRNREAQAGSERLGLLGGRKDEKSAG